MPPQRSGVAVDVNAVHATVLRALIESGEWDKIRALFVSRLNESGFIDSMRNAAKDEAAKPDIPFETLRAKMIVPAHKKLPLTARTELREILRQNLEKLV